MGSVGMIGFVEERLELVLAGGLLLLHQLGVALGDAPAVWRRHGGAERTAGRRLQLLPVVATSPAQRRALKTCYGLILRHPKRDFGA